MRTTGAFLLLTLALLPTSLPQSSPEAKTISSARHSVAAMRPVGVDRSACGTVVSPSEVVTCAHAVAGWRECWVTTFDGSECRGTVVATSVKDDLALVRIDDKIMHGNMRAVTWGTVEVGEKVFAIGHPLGYNWTVTAGVLSATGRTIDLPNGATLPGMLQHDAAINPGSSGGPLLNSRGECVGIVCAMRDGGYGIGFVISAEKVKKFLK